MPSNPQDTTYGSDADLLEERLREEAELREMAATRVDARIAAAVLREREECAALATASRAKAYERHAGNRIGYIMACDDVADAIRARSK